MDDKRYSFWKRVISGKQLMEGYRIPRGWGISYVKWESDHSVIHPIPLNYIVAAARRLLHKLQMPHFIQQEKERLTTEHLLGWHEGWEEHKKFVEDRKVEQQVEEVTFKEKIQKGLMRAAKYEKDEKKKSSNETNKPDGL